MKTVKALKLVALSSAILLTACDDDDYMAPEMNEAPVASKLTIMTETDTPVMDQLQADDPNDDTLTFSIVTEPESGMVELSSDGSFTYTPSKEFTGDDVFTFVASDGNLASEPAMVDITVNIKQEVFSSYSREAYSKPSDAEASGVNGREFTFDVNTTDTYQDFVQDGEQ